MDEDDNGKFRLERVDSLKTNRIKMNLGGTHITSAYPSETNDVIYKCILLQFALK